MVETEENYTFPWGFHLGELLKDNEPMPLYTPSNDGGFCLIYDKVSEKKVDKLMESLCLELLASMPAKSLHVDLFDFGKKKFYSLSPLKYMEHYTASYTKEMINDRFETLEDIIVSRHTDILCCNRQTINEHNQKSRMKLNYHLVLINLENFPNDAIELRRINNFLESAVLAGVYVIAFGYHDILKSEDAGVQAMLKHFKNIKITNNEYAINKEIFEFDELLETHTFEPLDLDRELLLQEVVTRIDLEGMLDPTKIKLETDTKVK